MSRSSDSRAVQEELCTPSARSPLPTVKILQTPSEIHQQRGLWDSWPGSRDSDLDFFLYIVGARPEVLRPHVLVVYHGDEPQAMLIGRLETRRVPIRFGYLRVLTPPLRILNFVYGALRGNVTPENVQALVSEVLKSLRRGEMDLVIFENLPIDAHLYQALRTLPRVFERGVSPEHTTHRCLRLPANSGALYQLLSPKHRQNYRRKGNKLEKDFPGGVEIKCYTKPSELDQMFRMMEAIAQKTYQRGLGFGFEDDAEMRGRCELSASKGWLRVYVLYICGNPCAYWNASAYCGTLWGDFVGYDSEFSRYSPGMYLSLKVIGDLCDRKQDHQITQIDFGLGDAEYKSILSNFSFQEGSVQLYGQTFRGMGIGLLSTPVMLVDRMARSFLAESKLLAKVKRAWRDRAASSTRQQSNPKDSVDQ